MKALTVKNIYNYYHSKTERSKMTLLHKLNKEVLADQNDPRNYWHRSLTAISKSFRKDDKQFIIDRIEAISSDNQLSTNRNTKLMYERNIRILRNALEYDFSVWRPEYKAQFISQDQVRSMLIINDLQIKIYGDDLFIFKKDDCDYIGAIWFVAQKDGYKNEDLALFVDALHRLLQANFSENYKVDTDYCMAVDLFKLKSLSYTQINNNEVSSKLDSIINEIKMNI